MPDKHADEIAVEIDHDKWFQYQRAMAASRQWKKIADDMLASIKVDMGDAYAITMEGVKVATYRPTNRYAEAQLCKDYPELTRHFMHTEIKETLDVLKFAATYPDIAATYRVRSFREVEDSE